MTTYEFTNQHSGAMVVLDADTEEEAWDLLKDEVKDDSTYELSYVMIDEDIPDEEPELLNL